MTDKSCWPWRSWYAETAMFDTSVGTGVVFMASLRPWEIMIAKDPNCGEIKLMVIANATGKPGAGVMVTVMLKAGSPGLKGEMAL